MESRTSSSLIPPSFLAAAEKEGGISDELVRLSIGIEEVEDIIADLDQALEQIN